jgi:hypothetical protein
MNRCISSTESSNPLHRRAAAEVDDALGQGRRAAGAARTLGHQHLGPGLGRRVGGGRPGGAEPDHQDVALGVPAAHLAGAHRRDVVLRSPGPAH